MDIRGAVLYHIAQANMPFIQNPPAPSVPYFTPAQYPASGTAVDTENAPLLFKPIKIRGVEFHNRIWVSSPPILREAASLNWLKIDDHFELRQVSPMCQYSADSGKLTDWHMAHREQLLSRNRLVRYILSPNFTQWAGFLLAAPVSR